MKVRATRLGYYGMELRYPAEANDRRAGRVFDIDDEVYVAGEAIPKNKKVGDVKAFSDRWMEKVDDEVVVGSPKRQAEKVSKKVVDEEVI